MKAKCWYSPGGQRGEGSFADPNKEESLVSKKCLASIVVGLPAGSWCHCPSHPAYSRAPKQFYTFLLSGSAREEQ